MKERQRGITLIALVITIVVLIILATISINLIIGENGIIARAEKARDYQANAETYEEEITQELLNMLEENANGGSNNIEPEMDWDLNKVEKVTSEDGEKVPVPKGYVASTVEGEKSVNTGFVIKEGKNGDAAEGINEFVWVPVRNISDIYDEANNAGQLWEFSGITSTKKPYPSIQNDEIREPDVVTYANKGSDSASGNDYDALPSSLQQAGLSKTATVADFKTQLQREFNGMIESVKKYGGFYIGRYETGDLSGSKAVVQKRNADIDGQTWYTQYRLSKTIRVNSNVISSMIWGCQWDATMRWMQNEGVTDIVKNYPTNSAANGNYSEEKKLTGSSENYSINNIYDMAGNVCEWTMEASFTNLRTPRGGKYYYDSSNSPASSRDSDTPLGDYIGGSRTTLYISL